MPRTAIATTAEAISPAFQRPVPAMSEKAASKEGTATPTAKRADTIVSPISRRSRPQPDASPREVEERPGSAGAGRADGGHGGRPEPDASPREVEERPGSAGAGRADGGHGGRPEPPITLETGNIGNVARRRAGARRAE